MRARSPKVARAAIALSTRVGSLAAGNSPEQETPRSEARSFPWPKTSSSESEIDTGALSSLSVSQGNPARVFLAT